MPQAASDTRLTPLHACKQTLYANVGPRKPCPASRGISPFAHRLLGLLQHIMCTKLGLELELQVSATLCSTVCRRQR
jgi:hypothetical protein